VGKKKEKYTVASNQNKIPILIEEKASILLSLSSSHVLERVVSILRKWETI